MLFPIDFALCEEMILCNSTFSAVVVGHRFLAIMAASPGHVDSNEESRADRDWTGTGLGGGGGDERVIRGSRSEIR
jgi:hypothetical protein